MSANKVRGEKVVSIGGTDFVLVPSFKRLAKVEAAIGMSIVQFISEARENMPARAGLVELAGIVQLLAREPKLEAEKIGEKVVTEGAVKVLLEIVKVISIALTGEDADDEDGDAEGKPAPEEDTSDD